MLFPETVKTPSPKHRPVGSCFSFADNLPPPSGHLAPREDAPDGPVDGSGCQISRPTCIPTTAAMPVTATQTWPDGASYEGDYRGGHKHGRGRFVWASGAEYDGAFVEGRQEGSGILRWPDGSTYEGSFKDG